MKTNDFYTSLHYYDKYVAEYTVIDGELAEIGKISIAEGYTHDSPCLKEELSAKVKCDILCAIIEEIENDQDESVDNDCNALLYPEDDRRITAEDYFGE